MEDLLAKLQGILNSDEGKQQLEQVAQMLGMDDKNGSGPDLSALTSLMGGSETAQPNPEPSVQGPDLSGIDLNMLAQVQKIVSSMQMEDDNTRLLRALRPHFSEERKKKVDNAIRMLQLFSLLPVIQKSGLLGGLLGDGGKQL